MALGRLAKLLACLVVLVALIYASLQSKIFEQLEIELTRALWWWVQKDIEAGIHQPDHGRPIGYESISRLEMVNSLVWIWSGRLYVRYNNFPYLNVFTWFNPKDPEGRFCRRLLDYTWLHPHQQGWTYPQVRATSSDIHVYIEMCRKEIPNLGPEERTLLDQYISAGHIPEDVVIRSFYDTQALGREARQANIPYPNPKLPRDELLKILNASLKASIWSDVAKEVPQSTVGYWSLMDIREVPVIGSTWKEVGDAIRASKIAKFDATPLLPKQFFNISVKGLAELEGKQAADRLAVLSNGHRPLSLTDFSELHEGLRNSGAEYPFTLADLKTLTGVDTPEFDLGQVLRRMQHFQTEQRFHVGYINNRRLKKMYKMLDVPKIIKGLGMEDDILRDEGFLWMGPVRGGFHYDEEANIYVQLSGDSDVVLIPPSHVNLYTNGERHRDMPSLEELKTSLHVQKVPFHVLRLTPGDAITFPGRGFHLFIAQTADRLAVNFFFLPKWGKMMYDDSDWYTSESKYPLGPERLALRQLFARTFTRLYEETGRSVIFMGEKNEYI